MTPPLCLFLALVCFVTAFMLLVMSPPEADMELHKARIAGHEARRAVLEQRLEQRRRARWIAIGALLAGGISLAALAFITMQPRRAGG